MNSRLSRPSVCAFHLPSGDIFSQTRLLLCSIVVGALFVLIFYINFSHAMKRKKDQLNEHALLYASEAFVRVFH